MSNPKLQPVSVGDRVKISRRNDGTGLGVVIATERFPAPRLPVVTVRMDTGGVVTRRLAYWEVVK